MKQILVLIMLLCSACGFAQDVIVKTDGSTIVCRVVELSSTEVVYKKWGDLNGSNYVMDRTMVSAINYENGKQSTLNEGENKYQPGNQSNGEQQYNDNALLQLDLQAHPRKIRPWRWEIKAGVSADELCGGYGYKFQLGYDISIGALFPLHKSNVVLGIDMTLSSFGGKTRQYEDLHITSMGYGVSPYVGYKFSLNHYTIMPYLGMYLSAVSSNNRSYSNSAGMYMINVGGTNCGVNLGADVFVTSKFYIDLHYKYGFKSNDDTYEYYWGTTDKLSLFKLVLGVGYEF